METNNTQTQEKRDVLENASDSPATNPERKVSNDTPYPESMPFLKVSILTNGEGTLNKSIGLDGDKICKNHPHPMKSGNIMRFDIRLNEMPKLLNKLEANQSLVHGIVKEAGNKDDYKVVSVSKYAGRSDSAVARSLECIEFSGSHISMLDHDPDSQCPHAPLNAGELLCALSELAPNWGETGHCVVPSTSAGLRIGGEPVGGGDGFHLYFHARNAEHLKDYMTALFKLSVIAGHGWIKVSTAGSKMVRSCFDMAVFSPERIDFTAPPTLTDNRLTQHREPPEYVEGGAIDCSLIPAVDEEKYEEVVRALKGLPVVLERAEKAVKLKVKEISIQYAITAEEAAKRWQKQLNGDLYADTSIQFRDKGTVTVGDILKNADFYNNEPCADPCEVEEGTSKAKFYSNAKDNKPVIHSQLHGGKDYFLHGDDKKGFELADFAYTMTEELEMNFPVQVPILGEWLKSGTMNMMHGGSGIGKTWVTLGICLSLATGETFIPGWDVYCKPMKVLMVDGEMDCDELRKRKVDMCAGIDSNPKIDNLTTISNLHLVEKSGHMLDLSNEEDRRQLEAFILEGSFAFVSLDNLSCLIPGINIKASEEYSPFNAWLIKLKGLGVVIQFVHHDNKQQDFTGANEMTFQVYSRLHVKKGGANGKFAVEIPKLRGKPNGEENNFEIMPGRERGLVITSIVKKKSATESAVFFLKSQEGKSSKKEKIVAYLEQCGFSDVNIRQVFYKNKGNKRGKKIYKEGDEYYLPD